MLNLFNILPDNFFQIFSGKNREIYAHSLLILFDLFENDESLISRGDFIKTLKDKNKDLDTFTFEDEEFDDGDELILDNLSSKASFICKRLEETGWIDVAIDPDTLEETIVLPTYSITLLRALKDVIAEEESPYVSLVHSTYSELKLEDIDRDELFFTTLERAYKTTRKLKLELMTITNSIRIYQNKLSKTFHTNKVLHDYFDLYKSKVSDRYYHPLKTFDSVAKFKRPIIKILENWLSDKDAREKLVSQGVIIRHDTNKENIENEVITMINYICDTYETVNSLISNIDKENNLYTKSSANKILYLNNTDKTIKGHLENIFKHYGQSLNNGRNLSKILSQMQDCLYYYEQGYIDSRSVTLPLLRKYREDGTPLSIVDFDEASDIIMQNFLNETLDNYSDERVYEFMNSAFNGENEVRSEDIPLLNHDAFVLLILATVKKDDPDCFYYIEYVDSTKILNHGYIIPNFVFHKKDDLNAKKEDE